MLKYILRENDDFNITSGKNLKSYSFMHEQNVWVLREKMTYLDNLGEVMSKTNYLSRNHYRFSALWTTTSEGFRAPGWAVKSGT